jgi:hypothetical protein
MVCLNMSLEDGAERRTEALRLLEVDVDKLGVRVDDGELAMRQAAE